MTDYLLTGIIIGGIFLALSVITLIIKIILQK